MKTTTDQKGAHFVPVEDRIATFDQDGTLWVEHPLYTQGEFALDRLRTLAPAHPEWKKDEPFKTVLAGDAEGLTKLAESDWEKVVAATHGEMTVEDFLAEVSALAGNRPASALPSTLHGAGLPTHARSDAAPARQWIQDVHRHRGRAGVRPRLRTEGLRDSPRAGDRLEPADQVRSEGRDSRPCIASTRPFFIDDHEGKPVGINLFIGKRPVVAFGNSGGDAEMLQWTGAGKGPHLMVLVFHDDAQREYAYGPAGGLPDTKVGTFPQSLMDEAKKDGWSVVSMKTDWKRVFP